MGLAHSGQVTGEHVCLYRWLVIWQLCQRFVKGRGKGSELGYGKKGEERGFVTWVSIIFLDVKASSRRAFAVACFIWETMSAVALKIRSKAGACQGDNCLNSPWIYTAPCSDKWLLCFPEKSDLLKHSHRPLFSFTLSLPPQTTEFGRQNTTSLSTQKLFLLYQVVSLPTQGRKLLCDHSGDREPLWEDSGSAVFPT